MSSNAAIVQLVDGHTVVDQTDDTIHIAPELWREMVDKTPAADPALGHAVLDIDGGTLTVGTAGRGLGRITYRFLGYLTETNVYAYERVPA